MLSSLLLPKLFGKSVYGSAELFNVPDPLVAITSCVPRVLFSVEQHMLVSKKKTGYSLCIFQPPRIGKPARWFLYELDMENPYQVLDRVEAYNDAIKYINILCGSSGVQPVSFFVCCADFGLTKRYKTWDEFALDRCGLFVKLARNLLRYFGLRALPNTPEQNDTLIKEMIKRLSAA